MAEDDIERILKQHNLHFILYEIPPGVFTAGDFIDYLDEISKGRIEKE